MQASTARRAFCRFAFSYLQELLGRPAPVLVCLQAAAEKVAQESRVVPGVLQFWGPVPFYQFKNLQKREEDTLAAPFLAATALCAQSRTFKLRLTLRRGSLW